jgi:hypothetical protein
MKLSYVLILFILSSCFDKPKRVSLADIKLSTAQGWVRYPPRLPEQPIFYPVSNELYAIQIARDWNVAACGSGFVTKFEIKTEYFEKFCSQPQN